MLQVVTIAGAVKSPRAEQDLMTLDIRHLFLSVVWRKLWKTALVGDEMLETNL